MVKMNLSDVNVPELIADMWEPLNEEQREFLANHFTLQNYKKNEVIHCEGETPKYLMCLLNGKVKIYKDGVGGRSQIIRMIKPVEYFGYRAYFAKEDYVTAAAAFEPSLICLIPMSAITTLVSQNNDLAMFFIKQLSIDLGIADERTVNLTQKHIRGRLAESLLFLKESYGLEEDGSTLSIYLSREDLANLSNMTTSNAIRTLSQFATERLITIVPPFDGCGSFFPLVEAMISDKDVSDHHAIIPTMEIEKADIKGLPLGERNLFLLVCCKLLCASAEPYMYEAVTATFDCCGHSFTAKGKRILSEGWREIDRIFRAFLKEKPADGDGDTLPDFTEGQTFDGAELAVTEHFTQPPKPYTEDTLLSAMENAGKDDIPDEAERKGLGTPATRAAIIEKLVAAGFVERKGKSLIPTKAGINLVTVLPEPLTSPMLTAEWEQKLTEIAKGSTDPDTFMDGIRTMVQEIVSTYSCISEDGKKLFAPEKEVIGTCPRCGQPVYEGKKNFACSDRSCGFVLWKNDRFWTSRKKELTKKMATDLLKKGRTNVKGMWSEKKQATYDAAVILDDTGGKYINFKLEFSKRKVGADGRK